MPGGTFFSSLVTDTVRTSALGTQLVGFPNDPLFPNDPVIPNDPVYPTDPIFPTDPVSVIRELYPVDPLHSVGATLRAFLGPDTSPFTDDLLL
jgi:hypothetical protein